ncbi:MAG TPA: nuclear transport factor 2 family protein [Blastocatellia bacterium]|nr:nuclear transport factor 2 family protein [Blastocatellia bacterium]
MSDPAIEQEIIKLAHDWIDAAGRRDHSALNRILADDFMIAGWLPGGQLADKQTYINDCLRPVVVEQSSYKYEGWKFRMYRDVVIANCTLQINALVGGSDWGGVFLFTQVWMKREERWQVVACHSSPVQEA